jgi:hypothetical protein
MSRPIGSKNKFPRPDKGRKRTTSIVRHISAELLSEKMSENAKKFWEGDRQKIEQRNVNLSKAMKGIQQLSNISEQVRLAGEKGRKLIQEQKLFSNLGRKFSEEHKQNLRNSNIGKRHRMSDQGIAQLRISAERNRPILPKTSASPRGTFGYYISSKAGPISYRSTWERRAYEILDSFTFVSRYEIEPFGIPYFFEGSWHKYYPDILATYIDGYVCLIEVKPRELLKDPQIAAKSAAAKAYCNNRGWSYWIWSEDHIFHSSFITVPSIESLFWSNTDTQVGT